MSLFFFFNVWTEFCSLYQILEKGRYNAPSLAVKEVVKMVPEEQRQSVKILDVAAGTGWVGRELSKKGFS